jgi:hypothetical protein
MRILFLAALSLALPGCIARTAVDIVTLPVKAVGKTADVLTTSQSEADEKRGRALRKREECLGQGVPPRQAAGHRARLRSLPGSGEAALNLACAPEQA